jgi:type I restriction-modification system DNA methylase subunit
VDNQALLTAIRSLAFTVQGSSLRAVDYKNLGPEELGSVYESLLELHPILNSEAGTFELSSASGHERKTTGSYYTPTSLIQVLLDSTLNPVIEQAVEEANKEWNRQGTKSAKDSLDKDKDFASLVSARLLNLKICDPACGSGHFLIAAAHRIARRLAQIQAGGDEPPPSALRQALRAVIARCIYGVDVNPMAVELCKVNLWLESLEPGKPLSFLDAHIQCGDSLVGVGPGLDISEIPDEAFKPAFGDDKATASALEKRNKRERGGQLGFRWKVTELTSAKTW